MILPDAKKNQLNTSVKSKHNENMRTRKVAKKLSVDSFSKSDS